MQQIDEYTEGWSAPIEYDLKHNNRTFDASGYEPGIVLTDNTGTVVSIAGTVEWADAENSRIRYTPDPGDLKAAKSPYTVHWAVTFDTPSGTAYYPQGPAMMWRIFKK